MARGARIILTDHPHHVTQRGNRKQPVFFNEGDYRLYRGILAEEAGRNALDIWAYCLMPNHVHIIAVPRTPEALALTFKETHRRYTRSINAREGWSGYLWQGRFASFAMKEVHASMAVRYVENNPVHAGMVRKAEDYLWSSARAHMGIERDSLLSACFLTETIPDWRRYLEEGSRPEISIGADSIIQKHLSSGDTLD